MIKEHWLGLSLLPVTMWRVVHEGLHIPQVAEIVGNGHQRHPILPTDTVLFFFGHNDIQKNVGKYWKDTWEKEIPLLAKAYVKRLKTFPCIPVVMAVYPIPRITQPTIYGSDDERRAYTQCLNNALEKECNAHGIQWINLNRWIEDSEGYITYTRDGYHLDYDDPFLVDVIEKYIRSQLI